ncbi:TetR/AcrR family transcriptional regulator [Leptospira sp. GIMC2001]|uniref:TetR/AcrR family transcriptional regulator n=1 Tax=Leptospira sp. GIMC2001 TaxID=1513297 RepID=UPI00234B75B1|nr:TetR/AcrR family transcriptional regulator [Leptospira sp. GIMC2001]WCL47572.1 TetR/AcrR family transcriptional regulator [Leptospira sp. GIMC2001]
MNGCNNMQKMIEISEKDPISPKKRSKREENREKSKELILRASLELFAMKGFGSTTMEMIADRAGISRGLPYLYFESKELLLHAIIERHFDREKEIIESLQTQFDSPEQFVHTITKHMATNFHKGTDSDECLEMRLIMSMMLLPETKSIIQKGVVKFQSQVLGKYFTNVKVTFEKMGIVDFEVEMEYLRMVFFGYTFARLCLGEEFPHESIQKRMFSHYLSQINNCPSRSKS